jgi:hypothetical protein
MPKESISHLSGRRANINQPVKIWLTNGAALARILYIFSAQELYTLQMDEYSAMMFRKCSEQAKMRELAPVQGVQAKVTIRLCQHLEEKAEDKKGRSGKTSDTLHTTCA